MPLHQAWYMFDADAQLMILLLQYMIHHDGRCACASAQQPSNTLQRVSVLLTHADIIGLSDSAVARQCFR